MALKAATNFIVTADAYTYKFISSEPKTNLDGTQKKSKDGLPQWSIDVMRTAVDSEMKDTIAVTVPAPTLPDFPGFVTFENMIGGMFWIREHGNKPSNAGLWFNAESISAAASMHAPRKAE